MSRTALLLAIILITCVFITCGSNDTGNDNSEIKWGSLKITGIIGDFQLLSGNMYEIGNLDDTPFANGTVIGNPNIANNKLLIGTIIGHDPLNNGMIFGSFTYTGQLVVELNFYTESGNPHYITFTIPSVQFINGHATIDWNSFSFVLPDTNGEFTLNGANEYNDKYAILFGAIDTSSALYGFQNALSTVALKGLKIENGVVNIPLYKLTMGGPHFTAYSGNDTIISLAIIILDSEDFDYLHYAANTTDYEYLVYSTSTSNSVTFNNGICAKNVSEAIKYPISGW